MCYIHRLRGPPSPRNTVIFDQVRKALLRIKILCKHNTVKSNYHRHNKGRVKLNSDHRNSTSRQLHRAAAALTGRKICGMIGKKKRPRRKKRGRGKAPCGFFFAHGMFSPYRSVRRSLIDCGPSRRALLRGFGTKARCTKVPQAQRRYR